MEGSSVLENTIYPDLTIIIKGSLRALTESALDVRLLLKLVFVYQDDNLKGNKYDTTY